MYFVKFTHNETLLTIIGESGAGCSAHTDGCDGSTGIVLVSEWRKHRWKKKHEIKTILYFVYLFNFELPIKNNSLIFRKSSPPPPPAISENCEIPHSYILLIWYNIHLSFHTKPTLILLLDPRHNRLILDDTLLRL